MRTIRLALALTLISATATMAQTALPPMRTSPSPSDPSIGAPANPSSMGNPAARSTPSMPAETGGGTVSGTDGEKSGDKTEKP